MSLHSFKSNAMVGVMLAFVTAGVYGFYAPASRAAYAEGVNAALLVYVSIFFRSSFMSLYCWHKGLPLFASKSDRQSIILGGVFQALTVVGVIGGLAYMSGPLVTIILFLFPLMMFVYMIARREISPSFLSLFSVLGALGGMSLVLDVWETETSVSLAGCSLALLAAVSTAIRLRIYGKQLETKSPIVVGAENFIVAFVMLLPFLFWKEPALPQTLAGYGWVALSVVALVLGAFGMFIGLAVTDAFTWGLLSKMEPVFVALYSALLIDEVLRTSQYAGIGIILFCLMLYQYGMREKNRKPMPLAEESAA